MRDFLGSIAFASAAHAHSRCCISQQHAGDPSVTSRSMEVDSPAAVQAAGGACAAPAADTAEDQPQSNSSAAAGAGQFITCMEMMYRRVPLESTLNRCVCVLCVRLCVFRPGLRWSRDSPTRLCREACVRAVRDSFAWPTHTSPWPWPQMQTPLSINQACCFDSYRPCFPIDRVAFAAAHSSNGYRGATLAHQ
jgi:hypothetical protein